VKRCRADLRAVLAHIGKEPLVKYMLFLIRSDEEWEALSEDEQDYEAIGRW
jgi:hypothetical protein